jgi:DNA-binding response OmpR family regulator
MPKVDGIELVRLIRADEEPSISRVPVILVTGDRSEDMVVRSSDANADAFLYKPVEPEILVETVERLLREKRT